ncbi:RICIN domain-containing protein [Streptomyces europaeiscabiei]|uniref:RICIN domain-containing protein n=1 Tax=Streptomyces europaeiscabiei TaxID=146819 RepID=UPI003985CBA6
MTRPERGLRTDPGQLGHRRLRGHGRREDRRPDGQAGTAVHHAARRGHRLVARHSGKVADVEGRTTANNSNVLQWPWLNKANQKWTFTKTGDGYYKIKTLRSVTS